MTAKELATMLNGREMRNEIARNEAEAAREAGLVVAFGYSDDCVQFYGAINGEADCYDGGDIYVTASGILDECDCGNERCPYITAAKESASKIKAVWNDEGNPCWTYETDVPHETFEIYEDGELFCVGIVFSTESLM